MVVPKFSRQYLSIRRRCFPIQADVAVKRKTVEKLSSTQLHGEKCVRTTLGGTPYPFRRKFLEFLKPFFEKVLSRCGQRPRPFFMEPAGWRAPVAQPKLALCTANKCDSSPDDMIPKRFVTFSGENLGWWYLNSRGSTFPSVDDTFLYRLMSQ